MNPFELSFTPQEDSSVNNGVPRNCGTPSAPPWEDTPPWESTLESVSQPGSNSPTTGGDAPVEELNMEGDVLGALPVMGYTEDDEDELEIFKKAKHFENLRLISGNRVEGGITEEFIKREFGITGLQRYKLASFVMSNLNYRTSPDVLYMLSCTNKARVVIATAGAGKTTSLQFDLIISKMLDKATGAGLLKPEKIGDTDVTVPRILYLNYNNHNVKMISDRHTALCSAVNKLLTESDAVSDELESSTVHAFCHKWLKAVSVEYELPVLEIMSDDTKKQVWEAIIGPRWAKFYKNSTATAVEYEVLDELYTFKTESMCDWDEFFLTAKFIDSGLLSEFVKSCIKKYDAMKLSMRLMDFTDYLLLMIQVLKDHPEVREKLQKRYRVIIADENQDFTRLMNELLIQLYDPQYNSLVVVGDPDQTIYDFKGVSPDNVVTLSEALPDVRLIGLDTNYRCPDKIVDAAKRVLDMNMLRFKKPIQTVKTGGKIVGHPTSLVAEQVIQVIELIKRNGVNEYPNTVVTYRNNNSAVILGEELYYAGIPFKILGDRRPFNNSVFKHIFRALQALQEKDNFDLSCDLYRFLPLSKDQWFTILNNNRLKRKGHLHDLEFPKDMPNGTLEALQVLIRISIQIDTQPVCDFIGALTRLYRVYYFDFIVRQTTYNLQNIEDYGLYFERMVKFFNRHSTFEYMAAELRERNQDNEAGVTLSTFHGLKGLEYDYVIAIDFNESIFPNYSGIESRYSRNTCMYEKESANRLCYVLVTRTIKELHLFYAQNDPSVYLRLLLPPVTATQQDAPEVLQLGTVTGVADNGTKMDFMRRLLGNRG